MRLSKLFICCLVLFMCINISFAQDATSLADEVMANPTLPQHVGTLRNTVPERVFEDAVFSPNERYIAINKTAQNWTLLIDNEDGGLVQLHQDNDVTHQLFSQNNQYLVTIDIEGMVTSWNVQTFQENATAHLNTVAQSLNLWTDTTFLINDGTDLILWDSDTGETINTFEIDFTPIDVITISNSHSLIVMDETETIHLFDLSSSNLVEVDQFVAQCPINMDITDVSINQDATYLYIICDSAELIIQSIDDRADNRVLENLNYAPFVAQNYTTNIFPTLIDNQLTFTQFEASNQSVELSQADSANLTYLSHYASSNDGSIAILQLEPFDDWETSGFGAPAFNVFDTSTGEIFFFFGQSVHAQFSGNDKYVLTVSITGDILLFQLKQ